MLRRAAYAIGLLVAYTVGRSAGIRHAQEARAQGYAAGYTEGRRRDG